MRPVYLILALALGMGITHAQDYQVLHVRGEILHESSGKNLSPGDKVSGSDKIHFKTTDAMAAVLSTDKGKYILKAGDGAKSGSGNDLVYVLKTAISPVRGGMSSRAGGINNRIDFVNFFGKERYVWAGDLIKIQVSETSFPMNENRFFYLSFNHGGETYNKMLPYEGDLMILTKEDIFSVDGEKLDVNNINPLELLYYDAEKEESMLMATITFAYVSKQELSYFKSILESSGDQLEHDIADMLAELYGKCDSDQIGYNLN